VLKRHNGGGHKNIGEIGLGVPKTATLFPNKKRFDDHTMITADAPEVLLGENTIVGGVHTFATKQSFCKKEGGARQRRPMSTEGFWTKLKETDNPQQRQRKNPHWEGGTVKSNRAMRTARALGRLGQGERDVSPRKNRRKSSGMWKMLGARHRETGKTRIPFHPGKKTRAGKKGRGTSTKNEVEKKRNWKVSRAVGKKHRQVVSILSA